MEAELSLLPIEGQTCFQILVLQLESGCLVATGMRRLKLKFWTTNSGLGLLSTEAELLASENFYVHIRMLEADLIQYFQQKLFQQAF